MQAKEMIKDRFNSAKNAVDVDVEGLSKAFKAFVSDIDKMIDQTSSLEGDDWKVAKEKLSERVAKAKALVDDQSDTITRRVRKSFNQTQEQVHDHPWGAMGLTLALGVACGALLSRRRR